MIVYINADGTIQEVMPENLTQGSNNQYLIVFGANVSNYTSMNAVFKLPNGQVLAPILMTKYDSNYVLNNEIVNVWYTRIERPVTNFPGTLEVTLNIIDVNGIITNSYIGATQIAPSDEAIFPEITQSAEEIFNQIAQVYAELVGRLEAKQDSYDVNLQTNNKTITGAINELNTKEMQNTGDVAELQSDIDDLKIDVNENKLDIQNQGQEISNLNNEVANIKVTYATRQYVDNLFESLSIGGNKALVFDTEQQFLDWLNGTYVRTDGLVPGNLIIGDIILLKEQGVTDYWVSSISTPMTINNFTAYEVKINLEDYATLEQLNSLDSRVEQLEESLTQITPDVARALKIPMASPSSTKLVAVSHTKEQEMITIGENLVLENNILKATGGGGGDISGLVTQTEFNKLLNNETIISPNTKESILVGSSNTTSLLATQSVIIGKNAKAVSKGVAIGYDAKTTEQDGGVAIGDYAETGNGVAIGKEAYAPDDTIAIGNFAETSAANTIQLGEGTNTQDNTLQIFDDNIYNHNTHTLTVQNITLNGEDLATLLANAGSPAQVIRLPQGV